RLHPRVRLAVLPARPGRQRAAPGAGRGAPGGEQPDPGDLLWVAAGRRRPVRGPAAGRVTHPERAAVRPPVPEPRDVLRLLLRRRDLRVLRGDDLRPPPAAA